MNTFRKKDLFWGKVLMPSKNKYLYRKNTSSFIVLTFFSIYFLVGLFIFDDYGVSYDESPSRLTGLVSTKYVLEKSKLMKPEELSDELKKLPDLNTYILREYGVVFELPVTLLELLIKKVSQNPHHNPYLVRHFFNFILTLTGLIFFFLLAKKRFNDPYLALVGVLFLLLSPRIFAHSFYNSKDTVFLYIGIIATYYLIHFMEKRSLLNAFLFAFASSLCVGTRIMGLIFPLLLSVFMMTDYLLSRHKLAFVKENLPATLTYVFFFIAFTIACWPFLWENPLGNFLYTFEVNRVNPWNGLVLYMGEFMLASQLPWHYLPVWISISTPVLYLLLFAFGIGVILWKSLSKQIYTSSSFEVRQDLVFIIMFFLPLVAVNFSGMYPHGGWRHLFFIYSPFLMIALLGLKWLWYTLVLKLERFDLKNAVKAFLVTLIALNSLALAYEMIKIHPYQNMYFNLLAGKNPQDNFTRDFWGLSYRKGLEYLAKVDRRSLVRVKTQTDLSFFNNINFLEADSRYRFAHDTANADYFISEFPDKKGNNPYPHLKEIHSIQVNNVKILAIYLMPSKINRQAILQTLKNNLNRDSTETYIFGNHQEKYLNQFFIQGWYATQKKLKPIKNMYLVFASPRDTVIKAAGKVNRKDVWDHFKKEWKGGFSFAGWEAVVCKNELQPCNTYRAYLVSEDKEGQAQVLSLPEKQLALHRSCSRLPAKTKSVRLSDQINFWIDSFEKTATQLKFDGWVFVKNESTYQQKVYWILETPDSKKIYESVVFPRSDVDKFHKSWDSGVKNENLKYSGYLIQLPLVDYKKAKRIGIMVTLPNQKSYLKWLDFNQHLPIEPKSL